MDFFKRNLFLTVLLTVVIIITIVLGFLIKKSLSDVKKYEKDIKLIIEAEKSFATSSYALNNENVVLAEQNYLTADERFKALALSLNEKFPPPEVDADMTPLKFKLFLRQACIRMENLLRSADIWIPDGLKYFSYDSYMRPDVLPKGEEIETILEQLEIVQELTYLVSQAQVAKLLEFKRPKGTEIIKRDLYNFMPFKLALSGNVSSIQRFVNLIHEAKYFLMIRSLTVGTGELKTNNPVVPARGDATKPILKIDRMVFTNEVEIKVSIILDYFLFHDKE